MGGHALIIGGPHAGLFAAHLLRQSGWRVDSSNCPVQFGRPRRFGLTLRV
jgi:hypothetical protein